MIFLDGVKNSVFSFSRSSTTTRRTEYEFYNRAKCAIKRYLLLVFKGDFLRGFGLYNTWCSDFEEQQKSRMRHYFKLFLQHERLWFQDFITTVWYRFLK